MQTNYTIRNIQKGDDALLLHDVFLIILYANRIPPHLAVSVNGKLFTLTTKGATIDGELSSMLRLLRKNNIETIFIRLHVPPLFTMDQLHDEIKKYTLAYPRVDVGIATCLNPIRDFCGAVYGQESVKANFIFELLPKLEHKEALGECYYMNMEKFMKQNSFALRIYSMNDIYEGIRKNQLIST